MEKKRGFKVSRDRFFFLKRAKTNQTIIQEVDIGEKTRCRGMGGLEIGEKKMEKSSKRHMKKMDLGISLEEAKSVPIERGKIGI